MIDQVKKVFEQLELLPTKKQEEIASLMQDELNWDITFEHTQEQLSSLAREEIREYDVGKISDKDWE